jgi:hypothetical protein
LLEVDVGALQQADLGCPQAVAVGQEENGPVAFGFDHRQGPFALILHEEINDALGASMVGSGWVASASAIALDKTFCPISTRASVHPSQMGQ